MAVAKRQDTAGEGLLKRTTAALLLAWRRAKADAWLLFQRTIAATAAWVIAKHVFDHHDPFFAPIAAVAALNAPLGERGSNALQLLLGVGVGIVVGELTAGVLGGGYGTLALSTFVAMTIARAFGGARVTIGQAAASAILTVTAAGGEAGPERLYDALIGAGVALVLSQFLFSPEPVALLRRAMSIALADMSSGLELTARALERDDDEMDERALNSLRDLRDHLIELTRLKQAGSRVARHSLIWRSHLAPVVREIESADHLDLLGGSCLMLTRTVIPLKLLERRTLAPSVHKLADMLDDLARDPGDRRTLQNAADRALEIACRLGGNATSSESALAAAHITVRVVAADIMVFAEIDSKRVADAMQERRFLEPGL